MDEHFSPARTELGSPTETGTILLRDINSDGTSSSLSGSENPSDTYAVKLNGQLYSPARDTTGALELWRTDGSTENTLRVIDLAGETMDLYGLTRSGNRIFFCTRSRNDEGGIVHRLWITDGQTTALVLDNVQAQRLDGLTAANGAINSLHGRARFIDSQIDIRAVPRPSGSGQCVKAGHSLTVVVRLFRPSARISL